MAKRKAKAKTLPDTPSELIRLAVHDLQAIEKSKRYEINMDTWHAGNGKCVVCFAGAVMARSLKADPHLSFSPSAFGEENAPKLLALDDFRVGNVYGGLSWLGIDVDLMRETSDPWMNIAWSVKVAEYRDSPKKFKADMINIADKLEACGF